MIAWLVHMADSATALVCLVVAICLFLVGRCPMVAHRPKTILTLCIACIVLYGVLEMTFDLKNTLISMLDRRPDLTTRVPMWDDLLAMAENPFLGFGWQSFWMGERQRIVFQKWRVLSTHNGYLDLYLNLGMVGLALLAGWILSGLIKVRSLLAIDYQTALLRFCFIMVVLLYNWTETVAMGVSNMFIIFLLGTMDIPVAIRDLDDSPKVSRVEQRVG